MAEVYKWNTMAPYTRHGQRIQAEVTNDCKVLFSDFDRHICGVLEAEVPEGWVFLSETQRIRWIHTEYLHNRYRMSCEPAMWELQGDFAVIRM